LSPQNKVIAKRMLAGQIPAEQRCEAKQID